MRFKKSVSETNSFVPKRFSPNLRQCRIFQKRYASFSIFDVIIILYARALHDKRRRGVISSKYLLIKMGCGCSKKAKISSANKPGKIINSSKCIKEWTHYVGDKHDFDVTSEGSSSRISN